MSDSVGVHVQLSCFLARTLSPSSCNVRNRWSSGLEAHWREAVVSTVATVDISNPLARTTPWPGLQLIGPQHASPIAGNMLASVDQPRTGNRLHYTAASTTQQPTSHPTLGPNSRPGQGLQHPASTRPRAYQEQHAGRKRRH